ncbi:hypothetical protein HKX48_001736 [Thoreauomyces humboldtii]|nr:hypothetical protein HKX48_001736 [Thoreauomyces humboldtii]
MGRQSAEQVIPRLDVDIIVDEQSAIILYPLSRLVTLLNVSSVPTDTLSTAAICSHIASIAHMARTELGCLIFRSVAKYRRILIILETDETGRTHPFTPPIVRAMEGLAATAAHVSQWASISWVVTKGTPHAAWVIRKLGDSICSALDNPETAKCATGTYSRAWTSSSAWLNRAWITPEESAQERLLCTIPVVNSFTAQICLTVSTLREMMGMTLDEMVAKFRLWMNERAVRIVHATVHNVLGDEAREGRETEGCYYVAACAE